MNVWRKCEENHPTGATDNSDVHPAAFGDQDGEDGEAEESLLVDGELPERTEDELYALLDCPVM